MFKKMFIVAGGLLLLGGLFFGRDACSYVRTAVGSLREGVRDSIPIGVEMDRAHNMIAQLTPEIRRNMHLIAAEEVQVDRLRRQVTSLQEQLVDDEQEIRQLQTDLESGNSQLYYAGVRYSQNQVRTDLTRRFERYQTNEATLQNLVKVLHAREQGLAAANEKLAGMQAARRQLEVEVANLEARKKMVEVAQATSDFNFDDSHLARTRELIERIDTRIEVAERLLDTQTHFHDEIPLDSAPENEDISQRITEYFNGQTADEKFVGAN